MVVFLIYSMVNRGAVVACKHARCVQPSIEKWNKDEVIIHHHGRAFPQTIESHTVWYKILKRFQYIQHNEIIFRDSYLEINQIPKLLMPSLLVTTLMYLKWIKPGARTYRIYPNEMIHIYSRCNGSLVHYSSWRILAWDRYCSCSNDRNSSQRISAYWNRNNFKIESLVIRCRQPRNPLKIFKNIKYIKFFKNYF